MVVTEARAGRAPARGRSLRDRISWELMLVLALQALFLWNLMRTGYLADDQINSSFTGSIQADGKTVLQAANEIVKSWITVQGRWFPVGFYTGYAQWHVNHSLWLYKLTLVLQALIASGCVWWLARELRASRRVAALIVVAITVAGQFRLSNDPHLAFSGLTQVVMAEIAISLLLHQRWLVRGSRFYLAGSLALFALAASTYEGIYALGPLYVLLVVRERHGLRAWVIATLPIAVVSVFFLGLGSYLRGQATAGTTGPYAPKLDLSEIVATAGDQLVGAVPLTYALFDPQHLFRGPTGVSLLGGIGAGDVLVGLAAGAVTAALLWRAERPSGWSPWQTAGLGLGLWVLTALPIGLAARYQAELFAGLAHVPVYFEEIGLAVAAVSLLGALGRRLAPAGPSHRMAVVVASVLVAALGTLLHRSNEAVVAAVVPEKQARQLEERALAAGLLDDVTDRDVVYLLTPTPWRTRGFYRQHAGKAFDVRDTSQATVDLPETPGGGCAGSAQLGRVWLGGAVDDGRGWVFRTCQDAPGPRGTVAYVSGVDLSAAWLSGTRLRADGRASSFGGTAARLLRPLPGRPGLRALAVGDPVDPRSLVLDPAPSRAQIVPQQGCYASEVAPPADERWCERSATLRVVDRAHRAPSAMLRFTVQAAGPHARRLTAATAAGRTVHPATAGTHVAVRVPLDARGNGLVRLRTEAGRVAAPTTRGSCTCACAACGSTWRRSRDRRGPAAILPHTVSRSRSRRAGTRRSAPCVGAGHPPAQGRRGAADRPVRACAPAARPRPEAGRAARAAPAPPGPDGEGARAAAARPRQRGARPRRAERDRHARAGQGIRRGLGLLPAGRRAAGAPSLAAGPGERDGARPGRRAALGGRGGDPSRHTARPAPRGPRRSAAPRG